LLTFARISAVPLERLREEVTAVQDDLRRTMAEARALSQRAQEWSLTPEEQRVRSTLTLRMEAHRLRLHELQRVFDACRGGE